MLGTRFAARLGIGTQTILGLAILTVVEFALSAAWSSGILVPLAAVALVKAWLILRYFMHVTQLWRREEHGHE